MSSRRCYANATTRMAGLVDATLFLRPYRSLRVIWELHQAAAPLTFRALREAYGGISSSVLTRRLAELAESAIVDHDGDGYALTPTGTGPVASLGPLQDWSYDWAAALDGRRS